MLKRRALFLRAYSYSSSTTTTTASSSSSSSSGGGYLRFFREQQRERKRRWRESLDARKEMRQFQNDRWQALYSGDMNRVEQFDRRAQRHVPKGRELFWDEGESRPRRRTKEEEDAFRKERENIERFLRGGVGDGRFHRARHQSSSTKMPSSSSSSSSVFSAAERRHCDALEINHRSFSKRDELTPAIVSSAFKTLALKYHPDTRNPSAKSSSSNSKSTSSNSTSSSSKSSSSEFIRVKSAFDSLSRSLFEESSKK
jgi:hypothetical protein